MRLIVAIPKEKEARSQAGSTLLYPFVAILVYERSNNMRMRLGGLEVRDVRKEKGKERPQGQSQRRDQDKS